MTLALLGHGLWAFLLAGGILFVGLVLGLFTRAGSETSAHGYNKVHQGAPGARGGERDIDDLRSFGRGTR